MKGEFVRLNNVQTRIITFAKPFDCDGKDVIICITGNPGITDFYVEFAAELHRATKLPLCIIGHAGHEVVPDEKSNLLTGQNHLFDLEGQVLHKLDLINYYIDKQSKLHLIGHSIGAWLILELLQDNASLLSRITSINLLFPTLQRMAETKNGRFLNAFIRRFHNFYLFLFLLASLIPVSIIQLLVNVYLKLKSLPLHYSEPLLKFLNPKVGEKVLYLAYDEMDTVKKLNIKVIEKIKYLLNIIYSNADNWAPVSYMTDLQKLQPHIDMQEVDIDHAFVLKSSIRVAEMVSQYINKKI